jgi:hypothetical protein
MSFSAAALVPNRSNRAGYTIHKGAYVNDFSGRATGADIVEGLIIAVTEDVDHDSRRADYRAATIELFADQREANPHRKMTAWFFRYGGGKWSFVGFGESLESLWEEGHYAAP